MYFNSKEEYDKCMASKNFVVDREGNIVCDLCMANCGQCGIGQWQGRCQEFYDARPELFKVAPVIKMTMQRFTGATVLASLASAVVLFVFFGLQAAFWIGLGLTVWVAVSCWKFYERYDMRQNRVWQWNQRSHGLISFNDVQMRWMIAFWPVATLLFILAILAFWLMAMASWLITSPNRNTTRSNKE